MLSKSLILIAGSILGGIAVIAVFALWLHRRISGRADLREDRTSDETFPSTPLAGDLVPPEAESLVESSSHSATTPEAPSLEQLALKIADADLRASLLEIAGRIRDEDPNFGSETSLGFIEEMVDRVDDLAAMATNKEEQTATALVSFQDAIVSILSACGAELIHSADWDPALQRAIAKEATSGITTPRILRFGSTGFRRNGQLIRKQEVVLAVPESN